MRTSALGLAALLCWFGLASPSQAEIVINDHPVAHRRCASLADSYNPNYCPTLNASMQISKTDYSMAESLWIGYGPSYELIWTTPTGGVSKRLLNLNSDPATCPNQYAYYIAFVGTVCMPPMSYFTDQQALSAFGRWTFEFVDKSSGAPVVMHKAFIDVVPAELDKVSGDAQGGVIYGRTEFPLIARLRDMDGRPVTDNGAVSVATKSPGGATGTAIGAQTLVPDADGKVYLTLIFGSKAGPYEVTVNHADAAAAVKFTATAALHVADEDDATVDDNVGENKDPDDLFGDPIATTTGNNFHVETDYVRSGLSPIEFKRSYNSLGVVSRMMVNAWTTTYDRYVMAPTVAGAPLRLRRPDGRTLRYQSVGGQWVSAAHILGKLTQTAGGWRYVDEQQTVETFDSQGRLLTIADLRGRVQTLTYSSQTGRLVQVSANTGGSLTLTYSSHGQLSTLTDHTGRVWTYSYDAYANLTQVKGPDGVYRTHHHEHGSNPRLMTGVSVGRTATTSNDQRQVTWEYDASGRATANYFPGNRERIDVEYREDGTRTVRDSAGRATEVATQRVNGRTYLATRQGPTLGTAGAIDLQREFDSAMNILSSSRFGRVSLFIGHDAKRQPAVVLRGAGNAEEHRTEIVYDARFIGAPTRMTEPSVAPGSSKVSEWDYDARGNVTRASVSGFRPDGTPVSRTMTFTYAGPYGQLTEVDGPRNDVADISRIEYDTVNGRPVRVIDANGILVRSNIVYSATGKVLSEDRPNGLRLTYTYTPGSELLQTLTETQASVTRKTTWTYTDRRWVASIGFGDAASVLQSVAFTYDEAGKVTSMSSADGSRIEYTLDAFGNVDYQKMQQNFSTKRWIDRSFDAYNRVDRIIQANSSVDYDYRADGTLEQVRDGRNQTTRFDYDSLKRMTRTIEPGVVTTHYNYDVNDRLTEVVDGHSATTRYVFDDLGNRLRIESPDSGVSSYQHDAAGRVIQSVDAKGQSTNYAYDAGGRLTSRNRVGSEYDEVYVYDNCLKGVGLLCSVVSGNGESVAFEYDGFGRTTKLTTTSGVLQYQYDALGQVTRLTYPSGRALLFDYSSGGRVTRLRLDNQGVVSVLAQNIGYLPFGPSLGWTYGNGLSHTRSYDAQYWQRTRATPGVVSQAFDLYDGNGNILQRTDGATVEQFGYDDLNRLDSANGAFGLRGYDYDAVGNRLLEQKDGVSTDYDYAPNANRLVSDTQFDWSLDANGNTVEKRALDGSGFRYDYSVHNRLSAVSALNGQALASYRYNALGQRTAKTVAGLTTRYVYDLGGRLIAERDAAGAIAEEYVYLNGEPLALLGRPTTSAPPAAVDVIVDNGPAYGFWVSKTDTKAYNGQYLYEDFRVPTDQRPTGYGWDFAVPTAGQYDVFVWFIDKDARGKTTYQVKGQNGTWQYVDLNHAGLVRGTWVKLGNFAFAAGTAELDLAVPDRSMAGSASVDAARIVLTQPAVTPTSTTLFIHTDPLGAPRALTNALGQKVWSASYDPFGSATINDDVDANGTHVTLNLRFPGQYYDAESGLHYNVFRDYDPSTGRYLESDPIGLAGGVNTYAYAGGSVLDFV